MKCPSVQGIVHTSAGVDLAGQRSVTEDEAHPGTDGIAVYGDAEGTRTLVRRAAVVARTDVPVLIMGESGTRKGVTAREIHEGSVRSEGSFIQANCGGLSEGLVDSELFGHEEGHSPVQFDLGQERSNWLTGGLSS